ncbi:L-carnitine dehydratase/bile acid-inducible protein F [Candidatus Filomicrobium marinum]|uniref:L-carnitine dehydratase/bile acid-inducible protein F n=1 Tax=Candidatus Filomicrobium marinum TaxID=1608628 RepID=A0A0D6JKQ9_9HYPH|nr:MULTISPECIES: CoA transferase [Filomicrobium]MCV0371338.1 CoA transferase [Filomicrobium sp.]CFX56591.1 L-carnitine dehydratase/bile acid-inducible protein F [Candidatus Filomicrobium marinum]CPR22245.1 L-carnitine dehydratase/bile acid-inducible protein F [Candidatus Filomicrobium marinum]
MSGPLQGCRVIELAHIMAGPVAGLMLADMGADVVKVEKAQGDDTRRFVPPTINGESAAFMMMNRNKRGIVLDLKSAQGLEVLRRLLRDADVVIENYRLGTMEKLGLGYEELRKLNPGLIYAEISGFGRTGPYAHRGGFDLIAQGMSGLMSITGEGAGRPPVKVGAPVSDITAGILLAMGIAAAYSHKLKTGEGQKVDTSLFEAAITQTYWQSAITFATGSSPGPMGSAHPMNAPYQAFETADGWINIGAANQTNWERLVHVLGAPELNDDPRFASNAERIVNREALEDVLSVILRTRSTAEWLEALETSGIPAGPVLSIDEMHNDPQTLARDMVPEVAHPVVGAVRTLGLPVKFSETPGGVQRAAPVLGQHTREVLLEAGYSQAEVEDMIRAGAARQEESLA